MVDFLITIMFILKETRVNEGPRMAGIHLCELSSLGTTETESQPVVATLRKEGGSEHQAVSA